MDTGLRALLDELHERGQEHDARQRRHGDKLRNLEPETAELVSVLVRSSGRTRLLEIGTSNGYSTIWLAWSAARTGGRLVSIELDPSRQRLADGNLGRAGLRDRVDLVLGDATDVIEDLSGPFDFVFFDADRVSAPAQLEKLLPKLAPDAMLLADNVLSHPEEISDYLAALESLDGFDRLVVPVGKGLSIAYGGAEPTVGIFVIGRSSSRRSSLTARLRLDSWRPRLEFGCLGAARVPVPKSPNLQDTPSGPS
jgi:predicted O-methyltransferase YrrM